MKWNEATRLLEDLERKLRELLAQAASDGDYASVLRITELARAVAALAAEGRSPASEPAPTIVAARGNRNAGTAPKGARSSSPGRRARPAAEEYPRFFRKGDELVKVGWSKKDRREYNHRAPRRAIDAVSAAVRQLGAKGRMFTGDKLLPLKDPTDNSRVADYQAYVALAWLKHLGIVKQHGRKSGYTLAQDKQIDSIVTAAWPELAQWRG